MIVKFLSFALVGSIGTFVHYLVLYVLVETQAYNPVWASGCGALTGLLVNYVLNFKLTFNSRQSHAETFPKFALIALFGLGFNLVLMQVLTQWLYYLYAQILTTGLVLIWNFFANHFWTFNMDQSANSTKVRLAAKPLPYVGLILTILLIRLVTLGLYPLYDPSESRYAEMARKMLETQNWAMPMIDYGVPFWGKPPLTIWLTALSLNVGGINAFAARLPAFLLGLGIFGLIYYLASRQRGKDFALSSVFVLVSSVLFFVMSGTVAMDQCMTFGVTLALSAFWLALSREKSYWGYAFFVGLSIGVMAKGPVTLVLTGVTIGLWTIITKRWQLIWQAVPWIKGTILMLCICVPWYLIAEQRTPGFLEYFFIGEHWKRFTESGWKGDLYGVGRDHARGTIWLYWLAAAFPWSLLLIGRLGYALKNHNLNSIKAYWDDWKLYCLLWMLAPLLFFTFSANLIWTYVLPGLPGMALLASEEFGQHLKYRSLLGLGVPVVFLVSVIIYQFPEADFFKSQKRIVDAYLEYAAPGEKLIYLNNRPYSAQFYLQGKSLELFNVDALQQSLARPGQHFYVFRIKAPAESEVLGWPILSEYIKHPELRKQIIEDLIKSFTVKIVDVQHVPFDDDLPEAVKARLEPVKGYGRYMLFHSIAN